MWPCSCSSASVTQLHTIYRFISARPVAGSSDGRGNEVDASQAGLSTLVLIQIPVRAGATNFPNWPAVCRLTVKAASRAGIRLKSPDPSGPPDGWAPSILREPLAVREPLSRWASTELTGSAARDRVGRPADHR